MLLDKCLRFPYHGYVGDAMLWSHTVLIFIAKEVIMSNMNRRIFQLVALASVVAVS
jgi:hypothetical protein